MTAPLAPIPGTQSTDKSGRLTPLWQSWFNQLYTYLTATSSGGGGLVPATRAINTTLPLSGGGTIANDLTLSLSTGGITNAYLAQVPAYTLKGNSTASAATPTDVTTIQNIPIGSVTPNSGAFTTVSASASISGSSNFGAYRYGTLGYSDTGNFISYSTGIAGYVQGVMQNTSNGSTSSVNFNVSNDVATSTTFYGEFGMNSSTFTGSGAFSGASAVYLAAASSDLVIGTYGLNAIHFVVNSGATDAMTIATNNSVSFGTLTTSKAYTVATLPAAGTAGASARAFVTDANATTFASIVAAGGANGVPVYSDGTNWRIG